MRKFTFSLVLLAVALLTSCVKKEYITIETPEEPKDESTYTIMMYGCGGGNLDYSMAVNIQEALQTGSTDRVKFTGQIKFSKAFQEYEAEGAAGTQRFIVGPDPVSWYWPEKTLPADLALYDPQTLTDFINWSKEQCPADEYILLLWNHGGAWAPYDDGVDPSRGVIYDDVLNSVGLSLDSLVEGIKNSGTKMKMIYYDACLMGMVEILSGLTECADYVLSASHITPGMGGDYDSLIYHLDNSTNFEQSIQNYCQDTMAHWNLMNMAFDLMLVDLSKMDQLLSEIKTFSSLMEEVVEIANRNKEALEQEDGDIDINEAMITLAFQEIINSVYAYEAEMIPDTEFMVYPYFDLLNFAELFASMNYATTYNASFITIASRLNRAFDDAIVCKVLSKCISGMDLSMGVAITDAEAWTKFMWDEKYPELKFDQATGWSNWVSKNSFNPTGNPNPDFFENPSETPDSGDEGNEEDEDNGEDEEINQEEIQMQIFIQLVLQIINSRN